MDFPIENHAKAWVSFSSLFFVPFRVGDGRREKTNVICSLQEMEGHGFVSTKLVHGL